MSIVGRIQRAECEARGSGRHGPRGRAVPADEFDDAVDGLVRDLLANSPGSLAAYKDLYLQALERPLGDGLTYEAATVYQIFDTAERLAGFGS